MKENLINKVVQARKAESVKKNVNNKLITIAKVYGSPIMGHYYDSPLTNEDWERFKDPEYDWSQIDDGEEGFIPKLGFVFDNLRNGVNLEIVVMVRETKNPVTGEAELDKPTEIKCNYRGYRVYHELEGILQSYAPFPEWENVVDKLYTQATVSERKSQAIRKEKEKKIRLAASKKVLHTLRMLWGI